MKTIFLDIDGVLNSNFWNDSHQKEISDGTLIDFDKVVLLSHFVKDTKAQIVLHSGWKYWFDENVNPLKAEAENLLMQFDKAGISVSGITPDLATEEIKRNKKFSLVKAKEILLWLDNHPCEKWIVFDDLDLHNEIISKHQIYTDPSVGLTQTDLDRAYCLLE